MPPSPPVKSPPTVSSPPMKSSPVPSPPVNVPAKVPPKVAIISPPPEKAKVLSPPPVVEKKRPLPVAPKVEENSSPIQKTEQKPIIRPIETVPPAPEIREIQEEVVGTTEINIDNAEDGPGIRSEESNGVGDKIKKFEKAAEDAGRGSRAPSVRVKRTEPTPTHTPVLTVAHAPSQLVSAVPAHAALQRQRSLTRAAASSRPRPDPDERPRTEPQKIIKPEFKPMPSPIDVTIRSPSLGAKIADRFPSHGTAFRNVASPDPRLREYPDTDTETASDHKCKHKNKEKISVSKGSSYFTRGSEEIWLVKKKDIEEIEERVLDSFRRAAESGGGGGGGGARARRHAYGRSESVEPARAARAARGTLRRQASAACTCSTKPRARSRSHNDDAPPHVLDKYETLV